MPETTTLAPSHSGAIARGGASVIGGRLLGVQQRDASERRFVAEVPLVLEVPLVDPLDRRPLRVDRDALLGGKIREQVVEPPCDLVAPPLLAVLGQRVDRVVVVVAACERLRVLALESEFRAAGTAPENDSIRSRRRCAERARRATVSATDRRTRGGIA